MKAWRRGPASADRPIENWGKGSSGTYFARLHAGEYGDVRKMVLLR